MNRDLNGEREPAGVTIWVYSREKKQIVPRSWGRHKLGVFKKGVGQYA